MYISVKRVKKFLYFVFKMSLLFFLKKRKEMYLILVIQNTIKIKNNKARHNLSNVKYRQMAFQSVDGAVVGSFLNPLVKQK